jgi:hypothetical protein
VNGSPIKPIESQSRTTFWFGIALIALLQIKGIEVAVREAKEPSHG